MGCKDCERIGNDGGWHRQEQPPDRERDSFTTAAGRLYKQQLNVLITKNKDYSPLNISMSPFGVLEGLVTRMNDKYWRIINLLETKDDPQHESLEDSFGDLMNYAAISVLCLRGEWPGVGKGGVKL